jgi:hypothetical protein
MLEADHNLFIETCFNYPTLGQLYKYATYDAMGKRAVNAFKVAAQPSPPNDIAEYAAEPSRTVTTNHCSPSTSKKQLPGFSPGEPDSLSLFPRSASVARRITRSMGSSALSY